MSGDILDRAAVAALLGITAESVSRYLRYSREGRYAASPFPAPDGHVGRSPYWQSSRRDELVAWATGRPGQGSRTDRRR